MQLQWVGKVKFQAGEGFSGVGLSPMIMFGHVLKAC